MNDLTAVVALHEAFRACDWLTVAVIMTAMEELAKPSMRKWDR